MIEMPIGHIISVIGYYADLKMNEKTKNESQVIRLHVFFSIKLNIFYVMKQELCQSTHC